MKTLLTIGACALSLTFFSSCGDMSTGGGFAPGVVGPSSASVNLLRTNHSRWAYDPYRRSYYDQTARRYYDSSNRRYYSSTPRRYDRAYYPSGYRSGSTISCPDYLPHVSHRNSHRGHDRYDDRNSARERQNAYLKKAYKDQIERENAQFEALLKRKKDSYDRQRAADLRAFKSRPRSSAETAGFKRRAAEIERRFKNEVYQLKVEHKRHVDEHLRDYKNRIR